ncbi:MAG: hypothetical protein M3327_16080, partial [Actinomycetota bacterium]|nr:hypothetical protein [Actinomycetota bacterium]
ALAGATVAVVAGVGLAGLAGTVPLWVLAVGLAALGLGAGEAAALGVLLEAVGRERAVRAVVVWSQVWAVGYLAGPVVAGASADLLGFGGVGLVPVAGGLVVLAASLRLPRGRLPERALG